MHHTCSIKELRSRFGNRVPDPSPFFVLYLKPVYVKIFVEKEAMRSTYSAVL